MQRSPSNQGDCRLVIGDLREDHEELIQHVELKAFDCLSHDILHILFVPFEI